MSLDRTLPHNLDAERSVLGAILVDNEALVHAQDALGPGGEAAFFRDAHRRIYRAMLELARRRSPIDVLTLKAFLADAGELDEAGGVMYLADLLDGVPRATNVVAYAGLVREKWCRRQVIFASNKLLSLAFDASEMPASDLLDRAEREMVALSRQQGGGDGHTLPGAWMDEAQVDVDRQIQERRWITGLAAGVPKLDKMTRGFQPGDFIIVAARPSMGKTALVVQWGLYFAREGTVLFFSLEMNRRQIAQRAIAVQARVHLFSLLTGHLAIEDQQRVAEAMADIRQTGFVIDDTPYMTPQLLRSRARRMASTSGNLVGIVVDYIGLVDTSGVKAETRQLAVAQVSREMKGLAKELNVPLFALSQLSRAPEARSDKRPQLSDLRESGSLEQDADVVLLLHRPDYYDKKTPDQAGLTEVIVAKQRNGPTGMVKLRFEKEQTRFEPWHEDQQQ